MIAPRGLVRSISWPTNSVVVGFFVFLGRPFCGDPFWLATFRFAIAWSSVLNDELVGFQETGHQTLTA